MFKKVVFSCLVFIGSFSAALAHHGWSGYDEKTPIKLEGTIQRSDYKNPHGTIQLKGKDDKVLEVILAPTSRMQARGLTAEMLKVGQVVTVEGYKKNADAGELRAERITVGTKTVELR